MDIDFFKHYNDHYGHPAGDAALIAVANCLKMMMQRGTDMAARYGGEEFIIVLPNFGPAKAELFAETIRVAINELNIRHHASEVNDYITVSIGISSYLPKTICNEATLLNTTDLALYQAKQKGRNRVQYLENISPSQGFLAI